MELVDAVLSDELDVGFAATITPWHTDLAHREVAQERLLLGAQRASLNKTDKNSAAGLLWSTLIGQREPEASLG